jgi:hypothetical protein
MGKILRAAGWTVIVGGCSARRKRKILAVYHCAIPGFSAAERAVRQVVEHTGEAIRVVAVRPLNSKELRRLGLSVEGWKRSSDRNALRNYMRKGSNKGRAGAAASPIALRSDLAMRGAAPLRVKPTEQELSK